MMKIRILTALLTAALLIVSLSTVSQAEGELKDSKSPIEKIKEMNDEKTAQKMIGQIKRIMGEGFTEDQAFKIYFLSVVPVCSKTEEEIKQMFREGKPWQDIIRSALSGPNNQPKKPLTNEEIIRYYEKGYNYSDIKRAQDMYMMGQSASVQKALESIGKNPPKNKSLDEMLIRMLKEGRSIPVNRNTPGKELNKEELKGLKDNYGNYMN